MGARHGRWDVIDWNNNIRELVDLPHGKSTTGVKWIYKIKLIMDGSISKHKAWLVAKRYVQQEGIGYEEIISSIARIETTRKFPFHCISIKVDNLSDGC